MKKLILTKEQLRPNIKELLKDEDLKTVLCEDYTAIGQEKAIKALTLGLSINKPDYNIYVAGVEDKNNSEHVFDIITEKALKKDNIAKTEDMAFVYNFKNPKMPKLLKLGYGGKALKYRMKDLINFSKKIDLKKMLNNNKTVIKMENDANEKIDNYIEQELYSKFNNILGKDFIITKENFNLTLIPMILDKNKKYIPLREDRFQSLPKEQKEAINKKVKIVQPILNEIQNTMNQMIKIETEKISKITNKIFYEYIVSYINKIEKEVLEYEMGPKSKYYVKQYLADVKYDIKENLSEYMENTTKKKIIKKNMNFPVPTIKEFDLKRYEVNLFINKNNENIPVIRPNQISFRSLFGGINYKKYIGEKESSHMEIIPGDLHKANGGFIILNINEVLSKPYVYHALINSLETNSTSIKNITEYIGADEQASLIPENIPLTVKIILLGDISVYNLLLEKDKEFVKHFKILSHFDYEIKLNKKEILKTISHINDEIEKFDILQLTDSGYTEILRIASREAGEQNKITAKMDFIDDLLIEAHYYALSKNLAEIDDTIVEMAYKEKNDRLNVFEEKTIEKMNEGTYLMDFKGEKIGEVNGLSVLNINGYSFGKPVKITVSTYKNRGGINNIDKKMENTGPSHNKGIRIITGYLGNKFGQNKILNFDYSIVFEQLYGKLDGDSASSTELYALLSSLSKTPLKQSIAVTGSVNQRGLIQPIGGVNEKIEGFYKICKLKNSLSEECGVIIPHQNIGNLNLNSEVCKAIEDNQFKIYAVKTIEEGLNILTGKPIQEQVVDGYYSKDSIFYKIDQKFLKKEKNIEENIKSS